MDPILVTFGKMPEMCDPILVTLMKMQPQNSQSSRENATPPHSPITSKYPHGKNLKEPGALNL